MPSDFTLARRTLQGSLDGLNDPLTIQAYLFRKDFDVTDGGTAATGVAESPAFGIGGGFGPTPGIQNLLGLFRFIPQVAVTANDTNYATFNIYKRTFTGARVLIATASTKITAGTGNLSAFVPVLIPVVSPPISFLPGDILTYEVLKVGTGVALSAATGNSIVSFELGAG